MIVVVGESMQKAQTKDTEQCVTAWSMDPTWPTQSHGFQASIPRHTYCRKLGGGGGGISSGHSPIHGP